ncbi:MAG: site-specific integrase [Chloroflexia bacterium]|nr:site-specific integrase [Chloroflexia bacterium]MDQ3514205.1 site-specific integrase [Chloroflexota bacterium]
MGTGSEPERSKSPASSHDRDQPVAGERSPGTTVEAPGRHLVDGAVTITGAVEIFFGDLRLAPRSKKTYRIGINKFVRHLSAHEGIDPDTAPITTLLPEHVTSYASMIVPDDIRSPEEVARMRTAQNNLSAIRKFCAYIAAYDLHPNLANDRIKVRVAAMMPRFTPPPPDVKLADLERMVAVARGGEPLEKPERELRRLKVLAIVLFLFRSGVRLSELCALRRRDIDLAEGTAHIYRAKGGKSRTVHFDNETAAALSAYWSGRGDPPRGTGALPAFSGRDRHNDPGSAISPRTVENMIGQLAATAGVESDVTPHSFRHGLATELVRRRVRESTVQTILGHASPQTTRIYVHKSARDVAEEYQDAFGPYAPPDRRESA